MSNDLETEVLLPTLKQRGAKPKPLPESTVSKKENAKRSSEEKLRQNARAMLLKRHETFQTKLLHGDVVSPSMLKAWEAVKIALDKALALQPPPTEKRKRKQVEAQSVSTVFSKSKKPKVKLSEMLTQRSVSKMLAQDLLEQSTSLQSDNDSESEVCTWSAL